MALLSIHLSLTAILSCACIASASAQSTRTAVNLQQQFQQLSNLLTAAESNDDADRFLAFYEKTAISMPEYQPMLRGIDEIGSFYKELFKRQGVTQFKRQTEEVIPLGKTIIEVGSFTKTIRDRHLDSLLTLTGKYCHIWNQQANGSYKIKRELSGFFHSVAHPEYFVVDLPTQAGETPIHREDEIPLELRALNALMEKYVKNGAGALRAQFFTDNGRFMPFAHPTVTGMAALKPYLIAYDTRGADFKFDSLSVYTYDYEYFDDYVLEYPKFTVKWSTSTLSGRAAGKNIRLWKRQQDQSLKMYFEMSTHNYLP